VKPSRPPSALRRKRSSRSNSSASAVIQRGALRERSGDAAPRGDWGLSAKPGGGSASGRSGGGGVAPFTPSTNRRRCSHAIASADAWHERHWPSRPRSP
jgi:hypothetical protein